MSLSEACDTLTYLLNRAQGRSEALNNWAIIDLVEQALKQMEDDES